MMLGRRFSFPKTSIWRFTLIFSSVIVVVAIAILIVVYQFTLGFQKDELRQRILLSANSFQDLAATDSVSRDEFYAAIKTRASKTTTQVLLLEYQGKMIGNLQHMPSTVPNFPQFASFPVAVTSDQIDLQIMPVVATRVSTNYGTLLIGSFDNYREIEDRFLLISSLVILAALVISLLVGLIFNRSVLGRVTEIAGRLERIKQGSLQARLLVSERNDEYDMISREVNQMLDTIDELLESVSTVTDNIAHDLRTPLSRIRIKLEENVGQLDAENPQQEFGRELILEIDRVIETFNSMLELSRLEKGVAQSDLATCSLEKICTDVVELILPAAEDKVDLQLQVENAATIESDPNLLFRAIYNVVDNAVNYTEPGGTVVLTVNERKIIVEDNGPGIPEEERERVFQRMYRLDRSRNTLGFGMGLAIVKAIVERLGGEIKLEDAEPGLRVIMEL